MLYTHMSLKILLPFRVFCEEEKVLRIVAESLEGSFGILPNRLDCVAPISPGIFTYETEAQGEQFLAVDEGILVKMNNSVILSVNHAIGGADLGKLHLAVEQHFLRTASEEKELRTALGRLESDFMKKMFELKP